MQQATLADDPLNVVITGVGGQGNVMASRMLGNMFSDQGFTVTIGETFGASQRGGSVMSHLRVSSRSAWSPQIPKAKAHVVVALEPIEALRVLMVYGNPKTRVLCNTRPIHPVAVICGDAAYPDGKEIRQAIAELTPHARYLDATDAALAMGSPILGNIMMIGALAATGELPFGRNDFRAVIARSMDAEKAAANMAAFDAGMTMVEA